MKLFVRVTPGARNQSVRLVDEAHLSVCVKEKAKENEANFAVIKALADHFKIPQSRVRLVQGKTSRDKVFIVG
jgi:hypothetical protein